MQVFERDGISYSPGKGFILDRELRREGGEAYTDAVTYPAGWLTTASDDELAAIGFTRTEAPDPEPVEPVPAQIARRQFFQALARMGIIPTDEALAAMQVGAVPAQLQALIDTLPEADQFDATMKVVGAVDYHRADPLVNGLGTMFGMSSDDIDGIFRLGATL